MIVLVRFCPVGTCYENCLYTRATGLLWHAHNPYLNPTAASKRDKHTQVSHRKISVNMPQFPIPSEVLVMFKDIELTQVKLCCGCYQGNNALLNETRAERILKCTRSTSFLGSLHMFIWVCMWLLKGREQRKMCSETVVICWDNRVV